MPMMLAQEASIIDIIGVPFLLSPPAPCSSLKPCWPALRIGPACKMAPARMLMMLSRRAAWNAPKPSLCWGFPTKTRVFGMLARPGEKRRSHEARSAALCARPLLLRSRPFMAQALARKVVIGARGGTLLYLLSPPQYLLLVLIRIGSHGYSMFFHIGSNHIEP